jgi:ketosteroid isomerase-like protein
MATPQLALDEIRLAMAETNAIFNTEVVGGRDFSALDQVYTSGARILPPGAPAVSGREEIKKFWENFIQGADATSAVLTTVEAMQAGDGVVEIGAAVITLGSGAQVEVKYVVYWRQEDNRWKWHVDIWNPNQ